MRTRGPRPHLPAEPGVAPKQNSQKSKDEVQQRLTWPQSKIHGTKQPGQGQTWAGAQGPPESTTPSAP